MLSTHMPENGLDPKEVKQWIKRKLAGSLKALQIRYITSDTIISSDDSDANALCCALEAVFLHGLRAKHIKTEAGGRGRKIGNRIALPQPVFWTLLKSITHRDVITELERLSFIHTDVGRCRAWLRLALNDCLMECYFISLLRERFWLSEYYQPAALLLDPEECEVILSYLQGLSSLSFELSYKSAVLNEWTVSPLSLSGLCPGCEFLEPCKESWDSVSQSSGSDEVEPQASILYDDRCRNKLSCSTLSLDTSSSSQLSSSVGSDGPPQTSSNRSCRTNVLSNLGSTDTIDSEKSLQEVLKEYSKACQISDPVQDSIDSVQVDPSQPVEALDVESVPPDTTANTSSLQLPARTSQNPGNSELVSTETETYPGNIDKLATNSGSLSSASPIFGTCLVSEQLVEHVAGPEWRLSHNNAVPALKEREAAWAENGSEKCSTSNVFLTKSYSSPAPSLPKSRSWISEDDFHLPPPGQQQGRGPSAALISSNTVHEESVSSAETKGSKPPSDQESKSFNVVHRRQIGLSNPFRGLLKLGNLERRGAMGIWKEFYCELSPFEFRLFLNAEDRTCTENCSLLRCEAVGSAHADGRFDLFFPNKKLNLRAPSQDEAEDWVDRLEEALQKCRPQQEEVWEVLKFPESDNNTMNSTGSPLMFDWPSGLSVEQDAFKESVLYMKVDRTWSHFIFSLSLEALKCFVVTDCTKTLCQVYGIDIIRDILPDASLGGPAFFRVVTSKTSLRLQAESAMEAKAWRELIRGALTSYLEAADEPLNIDWSRSSQVVVREDSSLLQCLTRIPTEKGLDSQNFKCAGCPKQIGFSLGKARLCAFSGLYYCESCHQDDESVIPSRVIHNWDLGKRVVCRRALKFLAQIHSEPLINVKSVNNSLYQHVEQLEEISHCREKLKLLGDYLKTCRSGALKEMSKRLDQRNYLLESPDDYSVMDLRQIAEGIFDTFLQSLIQFASNHIYQCDLCSQRGFICQICHQDDIIFPFQFDTTARCPECKTVFHLNCKNGVLMCPRCTRRKKYRQQSLQICLD
uniref:Pleckstrin homology domain-containing family M member 1 n=1 Tax=Geotrypetes seraphini TaxID=260995 RepID=A0A6P8PEU2_GEOSA|nr:pleckstrin homology domain-containing family M member 1 [Geotrypetes seraphini]XP_033774116.1 pleckstrin homology domain-containing family M member 1 [Geotrypetes seraphini]XP_033774117.1 pleckstrin homology domain-containing family M member 1 [Geotrypetes seraphini]XP_033774118.1 pleckstrin homology domain-containing family M member 1 [Geotrypetes seraphini]